MANSSSNSRSLVLLLLTSVFFMTGILFDYMPMIIDNQIKRTIELATNEEIRSIWSKPPIDFHSYYWLYDVLNAEKFMTGEKAQVRKVGPYHFTYRVEKRIIELSQNKYRLIYNSTRHVYLDESAPSGSLDEPLKLLNPVYAALIAASPEFVKDFDPETRQLALTSIEALSNRFNESLFINTTAREALLGRRVALIEKARKMADTFGFDIKLPDSMTNNTFGYVYNVNGTWTGPFEIYTGYQASMQSLGDIISYQGKRRLTQFQGRCNRLQTSAGELRPMPIGNNQVLELFQPGFCKILHLKPTGLRKLREGVAISYVLAPEDFSSAQLNPDNRCFCLNGTNNYCSLNGAVELGPCSYHTPILITTSSIEPDTKITGSLQDWDPELLSSEVELLPHVDNSCQILVLKRIGVAIQADLTFTLFMKVSRDPQFKNARSLPEVSYIPVVMVRERASIPPSLGHVIVNLESFLALSRHIKVIMYLSAIVLLCWLSRHFYKKSAKDRVMPSAAGGNGAGGGGAGEGPQDSASECANSGDSNRSQPPSRVSHSSLDVGAISYASCDSQHTTGRAQQASVSAETVPVNYPSSDSRQTSIRQTSIRSVVGRQQQRQHQSAVDGEQLSNSLSTDRPESLSRKERGVRVARAFSKVDEQLLRQLQSSSAQNDPKETLLSNQQVQLNRTETDEGKLDNDSSNDYRQQRSSKNWFMKVCSNFVRILNGIRSTISDVGQLDISETDYQDKQLEMLAGKIDNWYSNSRTATDGEGSAPLSTNEVVAQQTDKKPAETESIKIVGKQDYDEGRVATAGTASASAISDYGSTIRRNSGEISQEVVTTIRGGELGPIKCDNETDANITDGDDGIDEKDKSGPNKTSLASGKNGGEYECESRDKGISKNDFNVGSLVERKDSAQSNQTIINNKSDTSGDESVGDNLASTTDRDDKAQALKQMELALEAKRPQKEVDLSGLEQVQLGAESENGAIQKGRARKVLMDDSSTSIDSILNGTNAIGDVPIEMSWQSVAADVDFGLNQSVAVTVAKLNVQIDDESPPLAQPTEQLRQQQHHHHHNKLLAANGVANGVPVNYVDHQALASLLLIEPELKEVKDERRDSGVKLDSRNGISDSSFSSTVTTTITRPSNVIESFASATKGDDNSNGREGNNNSHIGLLLTQANQHQQIKDGGSINPHNARTKLPDANGKIMFQRHTNDTLDNQLAAS